MIVINLLLWLSGILGFVGVIGIFVFIPIGAIILAKAGKETNLEIRKAKNKRGIVFILLPFGMIVLGLIILILLRLVLKA